MMTAKAWGQRSRPPLVGLLTVVLACLPGCALSGRRLAAEAGSAPSAESPVDLSSRATGSGPLAGAATAYRPGARPAEEGTGDPAPAGAHQLASAAFELPGSAAKGDPKATAPGEPSSAAAAALPTPERLPPISAGPVRLERGQLQADLSHASSDGDRLHLPQVLRSVAESYPLVEVAWLDLQAADGKALAAWGAFDTKFSAHSIAAPLGFYENYRQGLKLTRPRYAGGEVYGGYRLGDGNIQPWFGERETNEGGEFKAGWQVPWMKDRQIDARRTQLWLATLARQQLEPDVQARLIDFLRLASQLYWGWLAAGQVVDTQVRLYELAVVRMEPIRERVRVGDLPQLAQIDNERFLAARDAKRIEAERKFQEAAIKLSLFYRTADGLPQVAARAQVPEQFPPAAELSPDRLGDDISQALAARPELVVLDFDRRQAEVELRYARNLTLPKLDTFLDAGQDMGQAASPKRDKSPFELEAGILAEVPLQRREGAGKIAAAEAKLRQIEAKRRFMNDKIVAEVQDAVSALRLAAERIQRMGDNVRLAGQARQLGEEAFRAGDIDLIALNIYETAAADAELFLIQANFDYFAALAAYRAALGIDVYRLLTVN